jgi:hypothetical protein
MRSASRPGFWEIEMNYKAALVNCAAMNIK